MQKLTLDILNGERGEFNKCVQAAPDIDKFCSSSYWILPAQAAFGGGAESWVHRGAEGYASLVRGVHPEGWSYIAPLEAAWYLACPLVGASASKLVEEFVGLCRSKQNEWDVILLGGIPRESDLFRCLTKRLDEQFTVVLGPALTRYTADLRSGIDGFWQKRSRNFRRAVLRSKKQAADAGICVGDGLSVGGDSVAAVYERVMAVESLSWKGLDGSGINAEPMRQFYLDICQQLARCGRLRIRFARHNEQDVGYILGGIFDGTYRGLQFSFDQSYYRYSLGNLLQLAEIESLCDAGVEWYDLGSDIDYKRRWGERGLETCLVVATQ